MNKAIDTTLLNQVTQEQDLNQIELEEAQNLLDEHPDFKVLRRLGHRTKFANSDEKKIFRGVIVDTETTGLSHKNDTIIELGMVLFDYDPVTGQVFQVLKTFDQIEQPPFPIPPESISIHGITDEMVAGKKSMMHK